MRWIKNYLKKKLENSDQINELDESEEIEDDTIYSITFSMNKQNQLIIDANWSEETDTLALSFGKLLSEINSGELSVTIAQTLLESSPQSDFINQTLYSWMKFADIQEDRPVISAMETFGGGK